LGDSKRKLYNHIIKMATTNTKPLYPLGVNDAPNTMPYSFGMPLPYYPSGINNHGMTPYTPKLTNEADNGKCGGANLKDRVLKIEELIKNNYVTSIKKLDSIEEELLNHIEGTESTLCKIEKDLSEIKSLLKFYSNK